VPDVPWEELHVQYGVATLHATAQVCVWGGGGRQPSINTSGTESPCGSLGTQHCRIEIHNDGRCRIPGKGRQMTAVHSHKVTHTRGYDDTGHNHEHWYKVQATGARRRCQGGASHQPQTRTRSTACGVDTGTVPPLPWRRIQGHCCCYCRHHQPPS
jgi:hypothetical protein